MDVDTAMELVKFLELACIFVLIASIYAINAASKRGDDHEGF